MSVALLQQVAIRKTLSKFVHPCKGMLAGLRLSLDKLVGPISKPIVV